MTLTLTVLGAATPYPRTPHEPCSGYLVHTPNTRVMLELGLGVWSHLLAHADPADLDGIWISHLHPDHSGDLLALFQWAANTDDPPRLPVHGPQGWADHLAAALPMPGARDLVHRLFHVREHIDQPVSIGGLDLAAQRVRHSVPTHGVRITDGTSVLGYSGDSGPGPALAAVADGADVFLCEAGSVAPGQQYHCAPEEAAAAGARAARTVLTHLPPGLSHHDAKRRSRGLDIARPGLVVTC